MELQTIVVRERIDELQRTANELRVARAVHDPSLTGLRRGLGRRLVALGNGLIGGTRPTASQGTSATT